MLEFAVKVTVLSPTLYLAKGKLHFPYYLSLKLSLPGHLNFPLSQHFDNTVKILKYSKLGPTLNELILSFSIAVQLFHHRHRHHRRQSSSSSSSCRSPKGGRSRGSKMEESKL